jgi:hypothetical protein
MKYLLLRAGFITFRTKLIGVLLAVLVSFPFSSAGRGRSFRTHQSSGIVLNHQPALSAVNAAHMDDTGTGCRGANQNGVQVMAVWDASFWQAS